MGYRLLLSFVLFCIPVQPWAEPVRLAALEWPPYTSQSLPDGGLTGHIVTHVFAEAGLEVEFDFYPQPRAVRLAADPAKPYSGYFPEYLSDTPPTQWRSSPSVGDSVLGIAQQAGAPISWQRLEDLAPYRIGVAAGYVNHHAFDNLIANKHFNASVVNKDLLNLRKLQRNRLDLAIIDREVFHWLTNNDHTLQAAGLQFPAQVLEHKSLHIMFRPDQQSLQQRVTQAMARVNIPQLSTEYQRRYLQPIPRPNKFRR